MKHGINVTIERVEKFRRYGFSIVFASDPNLAIADWCRDIVTAGGQHAPLLRPPPPHLLYITERVRRSLRNCATWKKGVDLRSLLTPQEQSMDDVAYPTRKGMPHDLFKTAR